VIQCNFGELVCYCCFTSLYKTRICLMPPSSWKMCCQLRQFYSEDYSISVLYSSVALNRSKHDKSTHCNLVTLEVCMWDTIMQVQFSVGCRILPHMGVFFLFNLPGFIFRTAKDLRFEVLNSGGYDVFYLLGYGTVQ
jgi:hypothetical protein